VTKLLLLPLILWLKCLRLSFCEGLIEVGEEVVEVFDTDGKADEFGFDAAGELLLGGELGVCRGGGVNGERFGVAEVGDVGEKLKGVDELGSGFCSSFDAEDDDAAAFAAKVFFVLGELGVIGEAGEADPIDGRVVLEMLGDGEGVVAVAFHAEGKGFDSLQELPGVVRRDAGTEIAKRDGAHAEDVGEGGEHVGEVVAPAETVVGAIGLVKEGVFAAGPVEAAGVDDDAAEAGSVTAEPFGEGVDDDIRAMIERPGEVRGGAGGVHDKGDAVGFGNGSDAVEVGDFEGGVGDGFAKEGAGFVVDGIGKLLGILGVDKTDFDAKGWKEVVELGVGAAVKVTGGDDVVTGLGQVDDGVENGSGARGVGKAGHFMGTFEQGDALFEHIGGGVHEAGIDVPEFAEGEEVGGVLGVFESER